MLESERTIGPYTLIRSLGRGGFGEVWLAERRSSLLTTRIALKLPILGDSDIDTIRREAHTWLAASGHPNIVPVLDAEVYDGQVVIASEFIAGGTLTNWLEKHGGRAPSVEAAVTKATGILAGLDYLHRTGLIHCDLKPDNVLLQDGAPRLTDFGLARLVQSGGQSDAISGTPRYMAPEPFTEGSSAASDLWSVGVILYEMLTGALPFTQDDIMELITAVQTREPAPLSAFVPERYHQIVRRLLSKSPSDRFGSPAATLAALQSGVSPQVSMTLGSAAASPVAPRHNLPLQRTSFIGRERERAEIRSLLRQSRLLTLTGSGGCGKTRLALQAAMEALPDFDDGAWFIELAPLTDPALVAQSIAIELGIAEVAGRPLNQTLAAALQPKRMLLVLDNCEHLLSACAAVVDTLLQRCPDIRIIATSRESLNMAGEQTFRVPSLALPGTKHRATPDSLLKFEGVRLFVERAIASAPDFCITHENAATLALVCRRLDGIPLAIELAAARTRSLTVEQISTKLDDRFRLLTGGSRSSLPRQQTLRALIDWSYGLLTEPERTLLRRLSVFVGGWTLEAAETVCADADKDRSPEPSQPGKESGHSAEVNTVPIEDWEVLDLLTALSDKSLLAVEKQGREIRYRLLETVRQYAADLLGECGETPQVRACHRNFYLALAEQAENHYTRPTQGEWLARLETEHDNLRAALDWCLHEADAVVDGASGGVCFLPARDAALRLVGALWRFWHTGGYLSEGRERIAGALARTDDSLRTVARAKALNGYALLTWCQGDNETAAPLYEQAAAIGRERADRGSVAASLIGLGLVRLDQADLEGASALFEQTRTICAEIGDRWGLALSLNNLGVVAWTRHDLSRARALYLQSLDIRREMEDRWGISMSLNNLGTLAAHDGDFELARALQSESMVIRRDILDRAGIAYSLEGFASLAGRQGRLAREAKLLGAAEALREKIGSALSPSIKADHQKVLTQLDSPTGEPLFETDIDLGRSMSLEEAIEYALTE